MRDYTGQSSLFGLGTLGWRSGLLRQAVPSRSLSLLFLLLWRRDHCLLVVTVVFVNLMLPARIASLGYYCGVRPMDRRRWVASCLRNGSVVVTLLLAD